VRILTNFMNAPEFIELSAGGRAHVLRGKTWQDLRVQLSAADLIVIDCGDALVYKIALHFLLFPWRKKPLVAVDIVLRKPLRWRERLFALIKRLLLSRVDHFIHYFKDIAGYSKYFGISEAHSSYVPFKANLWGVQLPACEFQEEYIFTMGVSLRDYDTFIRAISELPYPAAIPEFSLLNSDNRNTSCKWTKDNVPANLQILQDFGKRVNIARNLSMARVVVIPIEPDSLCASGISTYLDAMYLGKCVIVTEGPGASDLLTDQALLVPPKDVAALRDTIRRAWEDDGLRHRTATSGRTYALALGGEVELLQRIYAQSLLALERLNHRSSGSRQD
jgi:glycosyltransferase involved in cell wall biosynthesis